MRSSLRTAARVSVLIGQASAEQCYTHRVRPLLLLKVVGGLEVGVDEEDECEDGCG